MCAIFVTAVSFACVYLAQGTCMLERSEMSAGNDFTHTATWQG
jgi:hypothetical protein